MIGDTLTYSARRIAQAIPLLLLISMAAFALVHLTPGGPTTVYARNPLASSQDLARLRQSLGLDDPLPVQYLRWLLDLVHGDWGYSYQDGMPVLAVIMQRLPVTLVLMLSAFSIAFVCALPVGVLAALRPYNVLDHGLAVITLLLWSMPTFWLGLMAQLVLAVKLRLLPVAGIAGPSSAGIIDVARHLVLPALVVSLARMAGWSRYMRNSMMEVLEQPFITVAYAKGGSTRYVVIRHALRNALLPLVTIVGLDVPNLFAGSVVAETVFAWPGMGRLLYQAVLARDYPVEMGVFIVVAVLVVLGNLAADLAYVGLDPRVRLVRATHE